MAIFPGPGRAAALDLDPNRRGGGWGALDPSPGALGKLTVKLGCTHLFTLYGLTSLFR